jgi:hypothetical protein
MKDEKFYKLAFKTFRCCLKLCLEIVLNNVLIGMFINIYSQTCLQRPPLGPQKSGQSLQVFQSKLVLKVA